MIDEIEKQIQSRTGALLRGNESLRAENKRLEGENEILRSQLDKVKIEGVSDRRSRQAALSLVEDAVRARQKAQLAEAAWRESEQRLRTMADSVPQLIWTNDGIGSANYFNGRWYEYSGLSKEQSSGLGWQALVHPDDAAPSIKKWETAFRAGQIFDCEYRLRSEDGTYRWFIGRNIPHRNREGEVTAWFGSATDIHDLKEAEANLRDREEQFRRAIEDAPIPVIMQAEDGQVLQISATWTELTGYTREDIPTFETWLDRAYGPGAELIRSHFQKLFSGEMRQLDVEFNVTTSNGEHRRWAFSASAPGTLRDGRRFIVGMALDITERQQAAQELSLSEERLRVALEAAGLASWDYNIPAGKIIWNDQHYHLFGLPVDGKEKEPEDFFRHVHPEDATRIREDLRKAIDETGIYRAEFRIVRSDGVARWMSGFGRAMARENGRIVRMNGVMFDITDQHDASEKLAAAEERLRLLVENALEHAIIGMDLDRKITSWNPGAERITGFHAEEMIGRAVDAIFTPEDQALGVPALEAIQARENGRASDNRWQQRQDGRRFWASGSMLPMRARPNGEILGFVKIARDETEVHEARQTLEVKRLELTKALKEAELARVDLEAANKAKDDFFAVLSHELRTPLTPIMVASQTLLRRKDLPDQVGGALEMIRRNVEVEASLVDDLLDVTRISRGKLELLRNSIDVHETILHAVEISRPDIESKKQRLGISLEAQRHHLEGDSNRLKQVVWNLLKNASKFTPDGGEVDLRTYEEGNALIIRISDTGIGLEPQALFTIFDPFAQASGEIARHYGGLGLGLAIAQATVKGHGGTLRAESAGLGQGTTFFVTLPFLKQNES